MARKYLVRTDRFTVVVYHRRRVLKPRDATIGRWMADSPIPEEVVALMREDAQLREDVQRAVAEVAILRRRWRGMRAMRQFSQWTTDISDALEDPEILRSYPPGLLTAMANRLMDLALKMREQIRPASAVMDVHRRDTAPCADGLLTTSCHPDRTHRIGDESDAERA